MNMSTRYRECGEWRADARWYRVDERGRFVLTDETPEEARRSFELYKQANWRIYEDLGAKPSDEEMRYDEIFAWQDNEQWYRVDENDRFVLTDEAPEEARQSFELWQKVNAQHEERHRQPR